MKDSFEVSSVAATKLPSGWWALVLLQRGGSPPEKILKILENGEILCILVAKNGL